jgi:PAS domain S-box-containing protein
MMSRMGGLTLLQTLKSDPAFTGVPIIVISARAGEESRVEGLEAGADDYLIKPFSAAELKATVASHIGSGRRIVARERALRTAAEEAKETLEAVLSRISDMVLTVDHQSRITYANEAFLRAMDLQPEGLKGRVLWQVFLQSEGEGVKECLQRAISDQVPIHCEYFYPAWKTYFDVHIYPSSSGLTLFATDNTERKQAEEALREADRQKDEFLAILAHELRNPLAPIQNAVTVMRRLGSPDPDLQWCRDVIDHQVAHMKRLLDDLLDISRITRGKVILRRECLEVATIINQAVEVSRPVIDERGHELIITTPGHPLHVDGDLTRLAQVLSNLLNNAAKYTPEDGRIVLETKAADEKVVFRVRDNGMGISPDVLPHVFDTLVRGDRAPHREYGGLGLGLTLVRSLVELHGGNVKPTAMVRDREASS